MEAGLYIHIPFCRKKCNYCDFYSIGGTYSVPDEYVRALKRELAKYPELICKTVYFGGGTPSLLDGCQVADILSVLTIKDGAEITLEANPETLTAEKLWAYRRAGVNRLSVGVQTVYDKSLAVLGRIHSSQNSERGIHDGKRGGL